MAAPTTPLYKRRAGRADTAVGRNLQEACVLDLDLVSPLLRVPFSIRSTGQHMKLGHPYASLQQWYFDCNCMLMDQQAITQRSELDGMLFDGSTEPKALPEIGNGGFARVYKGMLDDAIASLDTQITNASHGHKWERRYQIMNGICDGVYYLHRKKIVHLDLEPTNVLLDYTAEFFKWAHVNHIFISCSRFLISLLNSSLLLRFGVFVLRLATLQLLQPGEKTRYTTYNGYASCNKMEKFTRECITVKRLL